MDTHSTPRRAGAVTFGRYSSADVRGGLLYMTDGGMYEVRAYAPDRGLARILRVLREPRAVGDALLEDYYDPLLEYAATPEERRRSEELRAAWPHAETLPWISGIVVDESGGVWVREYQHRFDPSPERWAVFDLDGTWLGRVQMPVGFTPSWIDADRVLGVSRGELGMEFVRVYALHRSSEKALR